MPDFTFFKTIKLAICVAFLFSTQAFAEKERKLVFVPGIVGSILSTGDEEVVWGDIGSIRGSNFRRLDLLPASGTPEPLFPSDVLREIPLVLGAFEVGLYGELIDFLTGNTSIFDSRTSRDLAGDFVEDEDFFVFPYDWRRSNFANAVALNDFIEENIPNGQYDIVAHSMGGLVSRIMISGEGPGPLCTMSGQRGTFTETDYQTLCSTIYGPAPGGTWPSDHMSVERAAAARLHTLIEIAVPHYGSVNVAATYTEGWGKISEFLIGSKRDIQNVALSWAAPMELIPTYDNCCAMGVPEDRGTGRNQPISGLSEDLWLNLVLGFDLDPCPYDACEMKRAIFRNGLENRARIDAIMDAGLPSHVVANHGIIGRHVKNTREVLYAGFDASGNGDKLNFETGSEGDGTVHRMSALLPESNQGATKTNFGVVMRSGHPFITGHDATSSYIFNTLLDPINTPIAPVSVQVMPFADGLVQAVGMSTSLAVMTPGETFDISLQMTQDDGNKFDRDAVEEAEIRVTFAPAGTGGDVVSAHPLELIPGASRLLRGDLTYAGEGYRVDDPGVYTVELGWRNTTLAKQFIYVVEGE